MSESPLLIYHHLPKTGGTSLGAVVRENYEADEMVELYKAFREARGESSAAGRAFDAVAWYRVWYDGLAEADRMQIKCVASHTANRLGPVLERPWRAFCLLRDPIERVWSLYHFARDLGRLQNPPSMHLPGVSAGQEIHRRGWSLVDIYREMGGGGPRASALHERFHDFFNGQARSILAAWQDQTTLEYWAGMPERGVGKRDETLDVLNRHYVVGVQEQFERSLERFATAFGWNRLSAPQLNTSGGRGRPDPKTRSLILAHNQLDAELHAHFSGAVERDRPRRSGPRASRGAAVCVLGMSRSGTSLTARILNVLGVNLGPEAELMAAASENNPAGFWEHKGIADLNEDILATLGDAPRQRWRWPPPLEEGWERDPRLEAHRLAAKRMLQQSFARLPLWGWKDPRTCLTLPFWQQVLTKARDLETRLRYVICVRHPLDVADSLQERDAIGREEALRLWLRYMSAAIVQTSGCPRTFASYEGYFPDCDGQVARLAEFLGLPRPSEAQRATIATHVDEGLWHHREARRDTAAEEDLPAEVAELYVLLTVRCGPEPKPAIEVELDAAAQRAARSVAAA